MNTHLRYFHYDHLGSVQIITDGSGAAVEHVRYDPYGAVRGRWDGAFNPIGSNGHSGGRVGEMR